MSWKTKEAAIKPNSPGGWPVLIAAVAVLLALVAWLAVKLAG